MDRELNVDLSGRVAAVTGGGGVLCSTMARALGRCGASVAILDIVEEAAAKCVDDICSDGGSGIPVVCNVLQKDDLQEAAENIQSELGPVDILVNGAGGNRAEATTTEDLPFFDLPEEAARWVFDLNFFGTFLASQVFGKEMAAREQGDIVNISSMNAFRPLTRIPAYSAAKSAVSNFTQWLAVHMNRNYAPGIRVNAIAPGFFLTEQNRYLLIDEETEELTPRGQTIIDHTPMGRFGDPEDLTGTLLWLLSESAEFVNGIVVPVDGGFSAFSGV
ncbi:MAG: SDR family oxidoreductase [Candidatus Brocadiia bacterium]|jgi:NAD(P)-dependent dehydrogenase (short-subunit alcohol dehydrogenase family)